MPPQTLSLSQKLSAFFARKIVWLWPQESKEWGLAFEAELPEITTPLASARWVMGGAALLARESLRHFLKSLWRPLGVAAPSDPDAFTGNGGPAPRLPRLFAGLLLAASLAMLCLPDVRASLGSSMLFRRSKIHEYFLDRSIQNLREKARTSHDPQLLAFLSLALWYDKDHLALADQAIRRDPSLTWVDYSTAWWFWSDTDQSHFLSDERIARLQAFDPQNAAPLLLSAHVISHPVMARADTSHDMLEDHPWERELVKNSAWVAAMNRAFSAPQFHDYFAQQVDLVRQVCARYHISDPNLVGYALRADGPTYENYADVEAYSRFFVRSGDEAAQHKNWSQAIQDYEKAQQFAERIPDGDEYNRWFAAKIGGMAAKKLLATFQALGRTADAEIAARKLARWDDASGKFQSALQQIGSEKSRKPWSKTERAGVLINLAVLLITGVFPVAAAALPSVGFAASLSQRNFGRLYRLVCLAADAAPIALVLSFALLLFVYHPYAHPLQNVQSREDLIAATRAAFELPRAVWLVLFDTIYTHGRYYFWVGLTSALSLIAFFLLYRMTMKKRSS